MKSDGVFVIAEAGVNYNGDLDLARRLVDAAHDAGADAVKFQSFRADALATGDAPKARYQERTTGTDSSQLEMLRGLELSEDAQRRLFDHCRAAGIPFLSSPFDLDSLAFLTGALGLTTIKIPSGEITNGPLLLAIARSGARAILSTGMADLAEIRLALDVLAFGYLETTDPSGLDEIAGRSDTKDGRTVLEKNVSILQCTTEYPAPPEIINLRAMATIAETFRLPVGFSDHSEGTAIAVAAAALGATIIEKHVTLDRGLPGPDHAASLEPDELARMIADIRSVEAAMGTGEKRPFAEELANRPIARKSVFAATAIAAGAPMSADALVARRPGSGLSPMRLWDLTGQPAAHDYAPGDIIKP